MNNNKRKLRLKTTVLTAILSAGLLSSTGALAASPAPHAAFHNLFVLAQDKRQISDSVAYEQNRKKAPGKSLSAILAGMTGLDEEYIELERKSGKSLEEIAEEYGVLQEYQAAVLDMRNLQLEELYRSGRISEEEFADMYNNADFIAVPAYEKEQCQKAKQDTDDSGDVAGLLAEALEITYEEAEERLNAGETPWEIAKEEGKFAEYKDAMLEHLITTLDERVANGSMTREEADEHIADFEFDYAVI